MRKLISADHVFPVETMVVLFFYFWENFIYMRWQLKFVFIYRVSTSINFLEKTSLCGFQHPNLKEDRWSFTIPIALPFITHQLLTYKILFNSVPLCIYSVELSVFVLHGFLLKPNCRELLCILLHTMAEFCNLRLDGSTRL